MNPRLSYFFLIAFSVLLFWISLPFAIQFLSESDALAIAKVMAKAGPIGDAYGVLNSLFTGLALAALVYAILIQSAQLKKQEDNLDLYKMEVEKTLAHLEKEDDWNRLKIKMDVLPHLCQRVEVHLRGAFGDEQVPEGFWRSENQISRLSADVESKLNILTINIKTQEESIAKLKQKIKQIDPSIAELTTEELIAEFGAGRLVFRQEETSLGDEEERLIGMKKEKESLLVSQSAVDQLKIYDRDLEEAYQKASRV
ncbi:hypothetical protein [Thiocapsa rosea]|uniref:Uncharacterized protein n=1 Tax=Thiocapsa rosea TaxID=69360 RepID=A0A495UNL9_9GAMM|nr:hypothetical protein [Thiocapsa rosea]RKT37860.1 hypothetical protein BDD21_5370 [Thiocapsa rosea]